MASDEGKKVTLKSSDGEEFLVDEAVAMESQTIRHMIEDGCADDGIPLPNVNSKILSKVIEYCKKHVESAAGGDDKAAEEDVKGWDSDFVKVDQATLFELILAANYLNIKGLVDLTSQTVEDMIEGKTPEKIRRTFNIKNDFTPDEEEEIRRENQWAFDTRRDDVDVERARATAAYMTWYKDRTSLYLLRAPTVAPTTYYPSSRSECLLLDFYYQTTTLLQPYYGGEYQTPLQQAIDQVGELARRVKESLNLPEFQHFDSTATH